MSNTNSTRERDVKRLQENLLSIRRIAGWTAETLGEKIGVTKQTISNLENGKTPMTLTQYIAIRAILDYEMENNKENTILPEVVHILLDKELDEENYNEASGKIAAVSASAAGGTSGESLASLFISALGEVVTIGALGSIDVGVSVANSLLSWMSKISKSTKAKMNDDSDNEKK